MYDSLYLMITIDKLETRVEKYVEKIRELNFVFKDSVMEQDADEAKNEAIAALESYLDLAQQDWDSRPQNETEESD